MSYWVARKRAPTPISRDASSNTCCGGMNRNDEPAQNPSCPVGVHGGCDCRAAGGGEPEAQHPALQDHLGDRSEVEPAAGGESVRRFGNASGPANFQGITGCVEQAAG